MAKLPHDPTAVSSDSWTGGAESVARAPWQRRLHRWEQAHRLQVFGLALLVLAACGTLRMAVVRDLSPTAMLAVFAAEVLVLAAVYGSAVLGAWGYLKLVRRLDGPALGELGSVMRTYIGLLLAVGLFVSLFAGPFFIVRVLEALT